MSDPRSDLKEDHLLWELVLACANKYEDANIFGNLHGFRCAGSHLFLKDNNLIFKFSEEYNEETRQEFKEKYALPYLKEFKEIFLFIAKNLEQIKRKIEFERKTNYLDRDIFVNGYIV